MQVIKAPNPVDFSAAAEKIFLAGSIEMGTADEWQDRAAQLFNGSAFILLNPRRDDWHQSWEQSQANPEFVRQVEWELSGLEAADRILVYFSPETKAPISLFELGRFSTDPQKMVVVCPQGFWRKGNVDIICRRYGIKQFDTLEQAAQFLKSELDDA